MCGIAGCAGPAAAAAPVEAMAARLHHRGPDARTAWRGEGVAFGHARLSIIDLAGGAQPYAGEDGRVTGMFNGEIYNFRALRAELEGKGHCFATASDGEVIVHLYEELGDAFVGRLRGMFALALWDGARARLLLARDRLGVKPLVYLEQGDSLWFASEAKALAALRKPRVGPAALARYLAYGYQPGNEALGLHRLPPGHRLIWEKGTARVESWMPPAASSERDLEEVLREAVRVRLVADVPVGAFLSGGLDSSLVTALMRQEGAGDLHSFSISVQGADESGWARMAAERIGTRHHERAVGPELLDGLPEAMAHLDEPLGDPAYLPNLALARLAREQVKVCLSGDGADEAFLGYRRYAWIAAHGKGDLPLRGLWKALGLRRWSLSPAARYGDVLFLFSDAELSTLLAPAFRGAPSPYGDLEAIPWRQGVRAFQSFDYGTYLAGDILPKVDLSSMAASLEVRSPFLDPEVQAVAAGLPVGRLMGKVALKELARKHLPAGIVDRPKQGFDLPLAAWLGAGRGRRLLDRCGGASPFFQPDALEGVLARAEGGDARAAVQLYTVLAFLAWARGHGILEG